MASAWPSVSATGQSSREQVANAENVTPSRSTMAMWTGSAAWRAATPMQQKHSYPTPTSRPPDRGPFRPARRHGRLLPVVYRHPNARRCKLGDRRQFRGGAPRGARRPGGGPAGTSGDFPSLRCCNVQWGGTPAPASCARPRTGQLICDRQVIVQGCGVPCRHRPSKRSPSRLPG